MILKPSQIGDVGRVGSPGFDGTGNTGGGELVPGGGETGVIGPVGVVVVVVVSGGGGGSSVVVVVGGDTGSGETAVVAGRIVDIGGGGSKRGTVTTVVPAVGVSGEVERVVGPVPLRVTVVVEAGRVTVTDAVPVPLAVADGAKRASIAPAVI